MTGPTSATARIADGCAHADVHNGPRSAALGGGTDGAETDGAAEFPVIQPLPPVRARWRRDADVVVVGSGAAGISAALTAAASGLRVLLVTKDLIGGATPLAQGGLAAAIGPRDSAASHVSDTLTAGAGLCEPDVVASLAAGDEHRGGGQSDLDRGARGDGEGGGRRQRSWIDRDAVAY